MNEKSSASEDEIHGTCSLARGAGDADAGAVERLFRHQVGNANFLEQFLHEQAVVAAIVRDDRRERRRIHHQRAVRRDHRREPRGKAAEAALERIAPGGVDQRDLDAGAAAVDFAQHRLEAEAVAPDVGFGPDLGVDRDHEALAVGLDAEAREEDQRHRAGLDPCHTGDRRRAASPSPVRFSPTSTLKPSRLSSSAIVAGVVDRFLQRRVGVGIFRVADHQRNPVATIRGSRRHDRRDREDQGHKQCEKNSHATAVQQNRRRSSSRRGDLTLRNPHYQTGPASPVNCPKADFLPPISGNKNFKCRGS